MIGLWDDVRLAARRLRQQPGFTAIATLTLALGLGANTAIFTLIRAVALDALPVDRPRDLVRLGDTSDCCVNSGLAGDTALFSFQVFEHLRDHTPELSALTAFQANTTPMGLRRSGSNAPVAVPSEFVTSNYFSTLGVRPTLGRLLAPDEIVGVVADVKYSQADQDTKPMFFMPALQTVAYDDAGDQNVQARSTRMRTVVLSLRSSAGAAEPLVRHAIAAVDPDLTVLRVRPMADQVTLNFRLNRLMSSLASAYGLVALALATLGLYGVTSFGVARRTREIGVRMALGANRGDILRQVLGGALWQTAVGLAIGVPVALLAARSLGSMLCGVSARDPWTFAIVALALIASAAAAAAIPARRAATIDPTQALRTQ